MKILVIKYSALGDAILIISALRAIRNKFPDAFIAILAGPKTKEVYKNCPYIDEIIMSDFKKRNAGIMGMWLLKRKIKKYKFDISIDIQNNNRSHILAFLAKIPKRYGYNRKLGMLCNNAIENDRPYLSPIRHQFYVLKELGIVLNDDSLKLWPDKEAYDRVEKLFKEYNVKTDSVKIGINIGASKEWVTKNLSPEKIGKLCDELNKRNLDIILTGMESQFDIRDKIISNTNSKVIDLVGKTDFSVLVSLIDMLDLYITPDSAPLHIAAAMNTPFIAYFGPTDPKRHLPPANEYKLLYKDISCSPCYSKVCKLNNKCLKMITVEEIVKAVGELVKL